MASRRGWVQVRTARRAARRERSLRLEASGAAQPCGPAEPAASRDSARSGLSRYGPMRALMAITALDTMSYTVMLAAIPLWQVQSGQAKPLAGVYTIAMLVATLVTQPAVPKLIGRAGTLRVQVGGLVALGAPGPLLGISHSPEVDVALSLVRGAGFGTVTVVGGILGATLVPRDRHGESVGLTGGAASFASLLFLPAGVALTHAGHFRVVGWLSLAPVLGIYFAVLLHRAPRRALEFGGPRRQRHQSLRAIASVTVALFVVTMALGAVSSYLPVDAPTAPTATIGLFGMGAAALLARALVGRLVDRKGTAKVLPVATGIAATGIWMVAASLSSRSTAAEIAVVAGCLVLGAGCGAVQTSTMVAAFAMVPQASISTASAAWNFSYDIGTALGVSVISLSVAVQFGVPGGFSIVGLAILLTVPAGRRSARQRSRGESDRPGIGTS